MVFALYTLFLSRYYNTEMNVENQRWYIMCTEYTVLDITNYFLQTNMGGERELVSDARYRRRLNLVTRALMAICGKNLENRLLTQEAILRVSITWYFCVLGSGGGREAKKKVKTH